MSNYELKEVFDINKFTVVGSPTITTDGIASGFSSGNYLSTSTIDFPNAQSWEVVSQFNYVSHTATLGVYQFLNGGYSNDLYINTSGYIKINVKVGASDTLAFSSQTASSSHSAIALTSGSDVKVELKFTGTQYIFNVYQNGSLIYADTKSSTASIYPATSKGINIGLTSYDGSFATGSIDLKQFKIYVNGEEVFKGIKTVVAKIPPARVGDKINKIMDYSAALKELQDYYANLLIIQYHNKPKAIALIKNLVKYLYADMMLFKIRDGFNILNQPYAIGKQLDCIGEWVGVNRIYDAGQPAYPWFSYVDWNQTTTDADQGGFQDWDDTIAQDGGFIGWDDLVAGKNKTTLADDLFLALIKLKIIKNVSTHTMDDLDTRLYQYFGDGIYTTFGKYVYDSTAFTVVGSPTITADGIASGFSSSNYLTNSTIIDTTKSWKAQLTLTTPTLGTSQVVVQLSQYFYLCFSTTKQLSFRTTNNTQSNWITTASAFSDNTEYNIEFGWDGTQIFLNYKPSNGSWINKSGYPAAYAGVSNATIESLGFGLSIYPFNGSIDLNSIRFYVDGVEVFSGQKYDGRYLTYNYTQDYKTIMEVAKVKNAVPIPTGMIVSYNLV